MKPETHRPGSGKREGSRAGLLFEVASMLIMRLMSLLPAKTCAAGQTHCGDLRIAADWERRAADYPTDQIVQMLHGLCEKVRTGNIES